MRASPSSLQKPDSLDRLSERTGSCRRSLRRKLARRGCRLRIKLSLNGVYALLVVVCVYILRVCALCCAAGRRGRLCRVRMCVVCGARPLHVPGPTWRAVRQCVSRSLFIEG